MASDPLDYTDVRAVARAFAQGGCNCGCARAPGPRAQGLIDTPGDYRLYVQQLRTAVDQIDLLAGADPQWKVFKAQFEVLYAEYKDVGWTDFGKLSSTTWAHLDEVNRTVQGWAERLRKSGKDLAPLAITPPPKPLSDSVSDAAKAFASGGRSLGDRIAPTLSTGTKVFLGLLAGGLALSQARPLLDRVLPAHRPDEPVPRRERDQDRGTT